MGSLDSPPEGTPSWVIPLSTAILGLGVVLWLLTYILMTRRSISSNHTAVPLLALGLNLSWEIVFAFYVCGWDIERFGFICWLILDIPLLYATIKTIPSSFKDQPLLKKHAVNILCITTIGGTIAWWAFAKWWFSVEGRGHGSKVGKVWEGLPGRDTTELAFWTAAINQLCNSIGANAMILSRGHSGGHSYGIWALRAVGSQMGLSLAILFLWYYWPEAHGYFFEPIAVTMLATITLCDLLYPLLVFHVRKTEVILDDGTVVAGWSPEALKKKSQ